MAEPRLTKFLQDQSEAVAAARSEIENSASTNGLRFDAMNLALRRAELASNPLTIAALIEDAKTIAGYLSGKS